MKLQGFQCTQVGHSATICSANIWSGCVYHSAYAMANIASAPHLFSSSSLSIAAVKINRRWTRDDVGSVGRTSGQWKGVAGGKSRVKWGEKRKKPGWPQRRKVKMQHCHMPLASVLSLPLSALVPTPSFSLSISLSPSCTCTRHVIYELRVWIPFCCKVLRLSACAIKNEQLISNLTRHCLHNPLPICRKLDTHTQTQRRSRIWYLFIQYLSHASALNCSRQCNMRGRVGRGLNQLGINWEHFNHMLQLTN